MPSNFQFVAAIAALLLMLLGKMFDDFRLPSRLLLLAGCVLFYPRPAFALSRLFVLVTVMGIVAASYRLGGRDEASIVSLVCIPVVFALSAPREDRRIYWMFAAFFLGCYAFMKFTLLWRG